MKFFNLFINSALNISADESGNSLRSSPHGRLRMRNRSLSGGSEDGRQRKTSVPQISVSECLEVTKYDLNWYILFSF